MHVVPPVRIQDLDQTSYNCLTFSKTKSGLMVEFSTAQVEQFVIRSSQSFATPTLSRSLSESGQLCAFIERNRHRRKQIERINPLVVRDGDTCPGI